MAMAMKPSGSLAMKHSGSMRTEAQGRTEELRMKFDELDDSRDGRLQLNEILSFLKQEGRLVNDRQATVLFARIDQRGTGSIDFNSFCDFVMSCELLQARKKAMKSRVLKVWDGPHQLKINGSWDRETRMALQEFLACQETPTARCVKPHAFVSGTFTAQHVIVLQELLDSCELPKAQVESSHSLACGQWTERTTRALHEMLLLQGSPTALHIGEAFIDQKFDKSTVFALQEFLAMMRKSRGTGLGVMR